MAEKKEKNEKKENIGSGQQSIEIPNSERMKSERLKELRKLQREAMERDLAEQNIRESEEQNELSETEGN